MPSVTTSAAALLLLSFTLRPLSSTNTAHPRRILHQPLLPQDSPPSPPPSPSPPDYPFSTSAPDNSHFFQSYPSPPPPPSTASFATFPANISSLTVPGPGPSKPSSTSSKLIIAAVAAVIAAITVVSLAVFLHLRHRTAARRSSNFNQSKPQSENSSTVSFNQAPPSHHIPKLHRPSQSSSEFLYLGTLVNSHAPAAAGGGAAATTDNYANAVNSRKFDSPELRPLPPLITQRRDLNTKAEVISSRDDESEEFYSPKGSINGRESSIGAGSASRRAFAAVEVENFNGSTSNSSTTYSSTSVPGSGSPAHSASLSLSPANNRSPINSMPKSPDLIEIQAPLPSQMPSPLHESASPSPRSSSSPERSSRKSEEISPRNSSVLDQNLESPELIPSPVHHSTTANPGPPEILSLEIPACASPLPETSSSQESSARNSNVSDRDAESPARSSSAIEHNPYSSNDISTSPELRGSKLLGSPLPLPLSSSPRNSNVSEQNLESLMSDNIALEHTISNSPEICGLDLPNSAPPLPPVESSPRNSNVSDQLAESPMSNYITVTAPPPEMQPESSFPVVPNSDLWDWKVESHVLPESPLSPDRLRRNDESSPRNSDVSDHNVESPAGIPSSEHNSTEFPTLPEIEALVLPEPASPSAMSSEESSPRNSNVSNQNAESPAIISSQIPQSPELEALTLPDCLSPSALVRYSSENEETSPRNSNASNQNCESPISSPVQNFTVVWSYPTPPETPDLASPSPESSPRISNVSNHNTFSELPSLPLTEKSNDFDQNMEPPVSIPTPPPSIPPPPPPPTKSWLNPKTPTPPTKTPTQPPSLTNPLKPITFNTCTTLISPIQLPSPQNLQTIQESQTESSSPPKPKLKPLHWDKVRASSDREMVWDQLKCSSFKLNEEMIETLFLVNTPKPNPNPNEATRWQVLPPPTLDTADKILDPKKAQNIAILLKALHVTVDEVCEGLLEGNADILGSEFLESLLKMAPTKEEERKLKECRDDSVMKLGPAERFLKAVVDIPHAFERVEALLYVSNFESEVDYLKKSFATLEAACEELRTSKMFLKLLEAVLKTGNRMNDGTNRGDAQAFKLDTLLKLVDVKATDGKTTLLHFVVQEIIRTEGARLSGDDDNDAKCRRLGLQVVSALSSELSNVKKAALTDAEALSTDVAKLAKGIVRIKNTVELNAESGGKFAEVMIGFARKAEEEYCRVQVEERLAMSLVKEITEYFHGNSAMEEPHPFRIFVVVREFLTVLDQVCKDVKMTNERTVVSSGHKFPVPVNPMVMQGGLQRRQHCDDAES